MPHSDFTLLIPLYDYHPAPALLAFVPPPWPQVLLSLRSSTQEKNTGTCKTQRLFFWQAVNTMFFLAQTGPTAEKPCLGTCLDSFLENTVNTICFQSNLENCGKSFGNIFVFVWVVKSHRGKQQNMSQFFVCDVLPAAHQQSSKQRGYM